MLPIIMVLFQVKLKMSRFKLDLNLVYNLLANDTIFLWFYHSTSSQWILNKIIIVSLECRLSGFISVSLTHMLIHSLVIN